MSSSGIFDELVVTEAAIRGQSVVKDQQFYDVVKGEMRDAGNPDRGNGRNSVGDNLYNQFIALYNFQFQDSSQHHKVMDGQVCNTRDLGQDQRNHINGLFRQFANENYDEQGGLTVTRDKAPEALQKLYEQICDIPLHHAEVTLGLLFVQMGRGDKWRKLAEQGIDFTRGDAPSGSIQRFRDALDEKQQHNPQSSSFIQHPESFVEIEGMRFMTKRVNDWQTALVTPSAHLLDLNDEVRKDLARLIKEHKPLDNYKALPLPYNMSNLRLSEYQNPSLGASERGKAMRERVKHTIGKIAFATRIDGEHSVYPHEQSDREGKKIGPVRAPETPVCMDVDFLTGLWMKPFQGEKESELDLLKKFMAKHGVNGFTDLISKDRDVNIRALPDEETKAQARKGIVKDIESKIGELKKKAAEERNGHVDYLLGRAAEKLKVMMPVVYEAADQAFFMKDKKGRLTKDLKKIPALTVEKRVYIAQGGTSSGKSGLKKIAVDECGRSLVEASLDDARLHADRYWLYPSTDNHNDDYKAINEFGNAVRDLIISRAGRKGYNLFIDGSGIPYQDRNDKIAAEFKKNGYEVSVLAAQAPINSALMRFGKRLEEELRIVPIDIFVDKHIGFAAASRNAARDPNVDRFMVQDVTAKREDSYTLSYVIPELSKKDLGQIVSLRGNELKEQLIARNLVPKWVKLPESGNGNHEYDLKVIRDNKDGPQRIGDNTYRVEIITDMHQYVNMVQKGLLHRHAKGAEALFDNTLAHDVAGHFRGENGRLRLQEPRGVVAEQGNGFAPLAGAQRPIDRVLSHTPRVPDQPFFG